MDNSHRGRRVPHRREADHGSQRRYVEHASAGGPLCDHVRKERHAAPDEHIGHRFPSREHRNRVVHGRDVESRNASPAECGRPAHPVQRGEDIPAVGIRKASVVLNEGLAQVWSGQVAAQDVLKDTVARANKVLDEEQARVGR